MTEATKKEAKVETNADKPEFILTKSGVMIMGDELLGDKLAALVCELINLNDDHGLASITFRTDNYPCEAGDPVFGMAFADTHSIAINLQRCFDHACEAAEEEDLGLGFMGIMWVQVLSVIGHELNHIDLATKDRDAYEGMRSHDISNHTLEESAQEASKNDVILLVKKFDTEIPAISELGWFGVEIMKLFTDEETKDKEFVLRTKQYLEEGIVYNDGENTCSTFREYIKMAWADLNDFENWEQPTTAVNLIAHMDLRSDVVIQAEPVKQPVIETVAVGVDKFEAVAEANQTAAASTPPLFIAAGMGDASEVVVPAPGNKMEEASSITDENGNELVAKDVPFSAAAAPAAVPEDYIPAAGLPAPPIEDKVQMPEHIAQEYANLATAEASSTPAPTETPTTFPPNGLSGEVIAATLKLVWQRLYHHVFTKCGWQQNPTTGRFYFSNSAAIAEGVDMRDIIAHMGADNLIMDMDTVNAKGQYAAETFQGIIRGKPSSKQGLPSYDIYLNLGGHRIQRRFVVQNPEKMDTQNAYSKTALEAQQGHMIAWVWRSNDEAPQGSEFKLRCAAKIRDNEYETF